MSWSKIAIRTGNILVPGTEVIDYVWAYAGIEPRKYTGDFTVQVLTGCYGKTEAEARDACIQSLRELRDRITKLVGPEPAKRFPILNSPGCSGRWTIAWSDAVVAWEQYHKRYPEQSLEVIAKRGGFAESELKDWLGYVPEIRAEQKEQR